MYAVLNRECLLLLYVVQINTPKTFSELGELLEDSSPGRLLQLVRYLNRLDLMSGVRISKKGIEVVRALGYDTTKYPLTLEYDDIPLIDGAKTIWNEITMMNFDLQSFQMEDGQ